MEPAGIGKQAASGERAEAAAAAALAGFVELRAQSGNRRLAGLCESLRKGEQPGRADAYSAPSFPKKEANAGTSPTGILAAAVVPAVVKAFF